MDSLSKDENCATMNLALKIARLYIPSFIKKKELKNLFTLTASAFGCDAPSATHQSFEDGLTEYARFTNSMAKQIEATGKDLSPIREQLYTNAFEYGKSMRKRLRLNSKQEVREASRLLYRIIGIDFHVTQRGEITIPQCFFSRYYSASTCGLIASLDAGILAGLSNGDTLTFSQRITEGFEACKAQLSPKEFSE